MPLWNHDHKECVGQEIVGERNVRSHVLNGLPGRAGRSRPIFSPITLWLGKLGLVLEVRHQQAGLSVQGIVRNVLTIFISPITL
jgi:hypothetical protein